MVPHKRTHLQCRRQWFNQSLVWGVPLEGDTATQSRILTWKIPWTEEPGGLQFIGSQRVRHSWALIHTHTHRLLSLASTHTELSPKLNSSITLSQVCNSRNQEFLTKVIKILKSFMSFYEMVTFRNFIKYKLIYQYIPAKIGKSIEMHFRISFYYKAKCCKHKNLDLELHLLLWTFHSIKISWTGSNWWQIPN